MDALAWRKRLTQLIISGISATVILFASQAPALNMHKDVRNILTRQKADSVTSWKAQASVLQDSARPEFPHVDWWRSFQDPALSAVVETSLENNPDLKSLGLQITQAYATAKLSRSRLLPNLSFNPQYTWERLGKNQFFFPIEGRTYQVFQLPLNAQYEVDLWGKNLSAYRASREGIRIARSQYESARIQLAGMVAASYFNVAKWRQLESIAQQELDSSDRLLMHSQRLLTLGQATLFDIQNAQQRRDQAQVNVTSYGNNRELAENNLLTLMGESPTSHDAPAISLLENLNYPTTIDTGVSSQLVLHRPDLAAAEAQLSAANFNVQAARRALLPSIMLNGSTGYNATGIQNLFKWSSWSSLAMATLAQQLYTGGRLTSEIKLRKVDYEQALNHYESTLIAAFTDAENSLSTLHADQIVYRDVTVQTQNARAKADSRKRRFQAGLVGEPIWLAEEVQRLEYEKQLTQQKTQLLIDVVGVAKALGGGF
jgi:multidrug efflux system outer membrane protein